MENSSTRSPTRSKKKPRLSAARNTDEDLYSDSDSIERMEAEREEWVVPEDDSIEDPEGSTIKDDIKKMQETLPIYEYKKSVLETVLEHDIVVITGETGSGKSTQLPQYIYDDPLIRAKINQGAKEGEV